jgi:hypothetical protein
VHLYPHSHSNPEIFPPLREMGFHLWLKQLEVFLCMCHNAFASSKVTDTLRFADVTNQTRQLANDAQIVGRITVSMLFNSFTFCFYVLHPYNRSILVYIPKLRIWRLKIFRLLSIPNKNNNTKAAVKRPPSPKYNRNNGTSATEVPHSRRKT